MKQAKYPYRSDESFLLYEFDSEGPKGTVKKLVLFTETDADNVYNLAFGDYDYRTGDIDDLVATNNGDSLKVLATVAAIVSGFLHKYPEAFVGATGSTRARTRLYRIGISNNLEEIRENFSIFGYSSLGIFEEFVIGTEYTAFLITKKGNTLPI